MNTSDFNKFKNFLRRRIKSNTNSFLLTNQRKKSMSNPNKYTDQYLAFFKSLPAADIPYPESFIPTEDMVYISPVFLSFCMDSNIVPSNMTVLNKSDDGYLNDKIFLEILKSHKSNLTAVYFGYRDTNNRNNVYLRFDYKNTSRPVSFLMSISFHYKLNEVSIYYQPTHHIEALKLKEELSKVTKNSNDVKEYSMSFVSKTHYGFEMNTKTIPFKGSELWTNLDENYGEGFIDFYTTLKQKLVDDDKGLYLFYGAPGTGKSFTLKHLITETLENNVYIYIPPTLVDSLSDPGFNTWIMDEMDAIHGFEDKKPVFIIEEAENLITSRDDKNHNTGISNLLNMTDGILNDIMGVKVICTFNTMLDKIDDALLRPGRLSMKKEFKKLNPNEVSILLKKLKFSNTKIDKTKDYSLAEIYSIINDADIIEMVSKEKTDSFGFSDREKS